MTTSASILDGGNLDHLVDGSVEQALPTFDGVRAVPLGQQSAVTGRQAAQPTAVAPEAPDPANRASATAIRRPGSAFSGSTRSTNPCSRHPRCTRRRRGHRAEQAAVRQSREPVRDGAVCRHLGILQTGRLVVTLSYKYGYTDDHDTCKHPTRDRLAAQARQRGISIPTLLAELAGQADRDAAFRENAMPNCLTPRRQRSAGGARLGGGGRRWPWLILGAATCGS